MSASHPPAPPVPPTPRPLRPVEHRTSARVAASAEHHADLLARLTARDRWIARMVADHRVLTSHQIAAIAFEGRHTANRRLATLYRWRVLTRFRPLIPTRAGSAPHHYVLDVAGAVTLAHEDGVDPATIGYRHDRQMAIAHSQLRDHTLAVNAIMTTLLADSRPAGSPGRLITWWSASRCQRQVGDLIQPDAYLRWHYHPAPAPGGQRFAGTSQHHAGTPSVVVDAYLELDRGTETLTTLGHKVAGYHALAASTARITPILIWLPSLAREAGARRALAHAVGELHQPGLVPIATTATDAHAHPTDPAAARWLPLHPHPRQPPGRLPLAALGQPWPGPGQPGDRDTPTAAGLRPPDPYPPTAGG